MIIEHWYGYFPNYLFFGSSKAGSFVAVAKTLAISQPSLSRHVQQSWKRAGFRTAGSLSPPNDLNCSWHFLAQIELILLQLEQARELTQRFAQPHRTNHFDDWFVASVLYGLLPEIISTVKQRHPNLDIKLVEINSEQQMSALKSGDIDVGFGRFRHSDNFVQQIFYVMNVLWWRCRWRTLGITPDDIGIAFKELLEDTLILYHRTPLPILQNPHWMAKLTNSCICLPAISCHLIWPPKCAISKSRWAWWQQVKVLP